MTLNNPTPYPPNITYIQDGEPVNQGVTNRPVKELEARTDSLREQISNANLGSTLIDWNVGLQADVKPGMAVYRDSDDVYRPAIATADDSGPTLVAAAESHVVGVVQHKYTNTTGNVILFGKAKISSTALSSVLESGSSATGQLYLSENAEGYLTDTAPEVGAPVVTSYGPDADGYHTLMVMPAWRTFFENQNSVTPVTRLRRLNESVRLVNLNTGLDVPVGEDIFGPVGISARFEASSEEDTPGAQALKEVGDNGEFKYGPIVEGLKSQNTTNLTISGGTPLPYDEDYVSGRLSLNVITSEDVRGGPIEFVKLNSVPLVEVDGIAIYEFRSSPLGSIVGKLHVPQFGVSGLFDLTLSFVIMTRASGTMPNMPITYKKLSRSSSAQTIPSTATSLGNLPLASVGSVSAGRYVTVDAPTIEDVSPGDLIVFTLSRNSVGGFPGAIGLIDHRWTIKPGS